MAGRMLGGLGLALLACLVAIVAAACSGGGGDSGTVTIGPDEPVRLRSMFSFTGAPSLAVPLQRGVELAVEDLRRIHGHPIEIGEPLDSACSADGGRKAAMRVIADEKALGVIGPSCSGAAVAASPLLSTAKVVMISPSNTSPALTSDLAGNASSDYHSGYFRVSNNDLYQARAVADFAYNELGLRRMAVVHDGDPYTSGLTAAFDDAFTAGGGEVAAAAEIEKGDTDMAPVLAQFAAAGTDGVFFPLFRAEGSPFVRQAREFDGLEEAILMGGSSLLVSEFLGIPESEGMYFAGPESVHGSNENQTTGKTADEVLAAYRHKYGESPASPYWAHAYDATTLLLAAIQRGTPRDDGNVFSRAFGVDEEGRLTVERAVLPEAIRQVSSDFQGLIGAITCDNFGDCGTGRLSIYHHTDSAVTDPAQLPVVYRFEP